MSTATPIVEEIIYPSGDGEPMAETPIHVRAIILLFQALEDFLRDRRPDDYVGTDMFWYWEEGNPKARCAPDVMVIPGVGWKERRSFFSWQENGAVPAVVFEMASENTWRDDLHGKYHLYAERGVKEYFMFDPEGRYILPQLQGFRLQDDNYVRLQEDAEDRLYSEELGLFLRTEGQMIRLIDAETGEPVLTRREYAHQAEQRAEQERERAEEAEQRAEQERQRANEADQRANEADQRAEQERQRVEALEAEIARLRALGQQEPPAGDSGSPPPGH